MYKKILTPFLIASFILVGSFGFFDAKKAEAAFSFSTATPNTVQNNPWGLAVEDLDGDTNQDVVVTNSGSASMSVLMGNGDGTFDAAVNYTVGSSPRAVVLADINGDTFLDALVSNRNSNSVSVLLGNGDGTFDTALSPDITCTNNPGCTPRFTAVGLLDAGTNPDLVIAASGNVASNSVVVQLGNGDGTFGTSVPYTSGLINVFVALYDFDGDTNLDIITANEGADTVSVLLGNGDGTFNAPTDITGIDAPEAIAIDDFDGDTNADIAVPALNIGGVKVYLGNGDGTFGTGIVYTTGSTPNQVDISDFDHDGNDDLVVSNRFSSNVSVLSGNGDGTFDTAQNFSVGSLPFNVKAGDFDGDGWDDLVSADGGTNTVSILLNTPHGKDITDFTFGLTGESDNIVGTDITVNIPESNDVTSLTPTITITGVSVSPDTGVVQDFTNPVVYRVTALDTTTKDYTVTVNLVPVAVSIESPADGDIVRMATPLIVTTDVNASCSYTIDGGSSTPMSDTGGTIHTDNLVGLSVGSHTVVATCGTGTDTSTFTKQSASPVVLYGVDGGSGGTGNLKTINPETGVITATIGATGHNILALGVDPTTGILYGTTDSSDTLGSQPNSLFTINTTTGAATLLGTVTGSGPTDEDISALAFKSNGTLYAWSATDDSIYTIDISSCNSVTCDATEIGNPGSGSYAESGVGLAFNSLGALYSTPIGEDYLVPLNPNDGSVLAYTAIPNSSGNSYPVGNATFDSKNMLFAIRKNSGSAPSDLITINTAGPYIVSMGGDNTDLAAMSGLAFSIDTTAPTATIGVSDPLLDQSDVGDTFDVTLTFSEQVADSGGLIDFDGTDVVISGGTLTLSGFDWSAGHSVLTIHYLVADTNQEISDIDINISAFEDLAGNSIAPTTGADLFDVDMIPTPTSGGGGGGSSGYYPVDRIPTNPQITTVLLSGAQCPVNLIITQKLKQGARDGYYSPYQGGITTQVKLLQGHINRILAAKYNQAAGPVDGIFGPLTKQGVQRLQVVLNETVKPVPLLVIDGIVGPFTKAAINHSCAQ